MPYDPRTSFFPADPSQWPPARALLPISAHPKPPPDQASNNPVGSDGIDDWIVPSNARSDPYPDYPDDWIVPSSPSTLNTASLG